MGNLCKNQPKEKGEEEFYEFQKGINSEPNLINKNPIEGDSIFFLNKESKNLLGDNTRYSNEQVDNSFAQTINQKSQNFFQIKDQQNYYDDMNNDSVRLRGTNKNNNLSTFTSLFYSMDDFEKLKNKTYYVRSAFELINKIRINPSSFSKRIEDGIKYIKEEKKLITNPITGEKNEKSRIIFKKKVKIVLAKGENAFKEAAEILKKKNPVHPLSFCEEIIIPLPKNEEEFQDSTFLKRNAEELRKNSPFHFEVYYKDLIRDPFISVLLMIVDDFEIDNGKKRECLLNPELKYIGINSKYIGKNFIAYFSFAK
jgi:hypothetical protein